MYSHLFNVGQVASLTNSVQTYMFYREIEVHFYYLLDVGQLKLSQKPSNIFILVFFFQCWLHSIYEGKEMLHLLFLINVRLSQVLINRKDSSIRNLSTSYNIKNLKLNLIGYVEAKRKS